VSIRKAAFGTPTGSCGSIAGGQLEIVSGGFLLHSGLFPLAKLLCLYPCADVVGTVTIFTVPTEDVAERGADDARNTQLAVGGIGLIDDNTQIAAVRLRPAMYEKGAPYKVTNDEGGESLSALLY
jgi:hypothetical protein